MKIEVKHRIFNPFSGLPGFSPLAVITADMEKDGWQLTRIIQHMQFESVAIFERLVQDEEVVEEQEQEQEQGEVKEDGGYI